MGNKTFEPVTPQGRVIQAPEPIEVWALLELPQADWKRVEPALAVAWTRAQVEVLVERRQGPYRTWVRAEHVLRRAVASEAEARARWRVRR